MVEVAIAAVHCYVADVPIEGNSAADDCCCDVTTGGNSYY